MNIELHCTWLMLSFIVVVNGCSTSMFFTCQDGTRIPLTYQCDGDNDCVYGDDELNCNVECGENERKCDSSKCILIRQWCDGRVDCSDYSDESYCPAIVYEPNFHLQTEEFTCDDQSKISIRFQCDGDTDCPDGSDEVNCNITCGPNQLKCDHFDCIPATWWCDGQIDCPDESDEQHCRTRVTEASTNNFHLQTEEFTCDDQSKISIRFQCNGDTDCPDGTDEVNCNITCGPNQLKCDHFDCIPATWWCDGQIDCPDESDEQHCRTRVTEASTNNSLLSRIEAASLVKDGSEKQTLQKLKVSSATSSSTSLLKASSFIVVCFVLLLNL